MYTRETLVLLLDMLERASRCSCNDSTGANLHPDGLSLAGVRRSCIDGCALLEASLEQPGSAPCSMYAAADSEAVSNSCDAEPLASRFKTASSLPCYTCMVS